MPLLPQLDIILASASPRREELLTLIVKDFRIIPSEFDESLVPVELGMKEHVAYCALMKAQDVAQKYPDSLVIGADTIVAIDNAILGKPSDAADAIQMLKRLTGRTHQVYTGIAVIKYDIERSAVECTDVTFRELDDDIIARYVATGEPMDKAGAYAIQGRGAILVKSICGCYSNVVGLPVYLLSTILEEFGVKLLGDVRVQKR
ncbi:MAG: Maf family protein [Armatimonadetes bacterium]|nr:Maf family protein [Armatimonadota bacterium]